MSKQARAKVVPAPSPPLPSRFVRWPRVWPYLALAALGLAIYANSLANGFVSDDHVVFDNPVALSWRLIPDSFGHDAIQQMADPGSASNYYRPIPVLFFLLAYHAAGRQPLSLHLLSVLVHMVNTLLIFHLGKRWLKDQNAALFAAALFAVHPINEQVVAWAGALPDGLLTLVVLATLDRFDRYEGSPRRWQIVGLSAGYLLALLIKETGVVMLFLLGGYEVLLLGRGPRAVWRNRWFYLSLLGVFSIYLALRIHALGGLAPAQNSAHRLAPREFALSAIVILGQYLGQLVVPLNLSFFHPFEPTHSVGTLVILCLAVILVLPAAIANLRTRTPLVSYGLFWILVPLLPALNLTGLGESVFNERYLYLPSVGFAWIAGLGWSWLAGRSRGLAWALAAAVLATSSYAVTARNRDWHDDLSLFTVTVDQCPGTASLRGYLGKLYQQRGEYGRAMVQYRVGLQLQPNDSRLHNNLGGALALTGHRDEAVREYREALALQPNSPETWVNLGGALEALGETEQAEAAYGQALKIRSNYSEALNSLALLCRKAKDYPAAVDLLQRAIAARPGYTAAHFNLGVTYSDMGRYAEAAAAFRNALGTQDDTTYLYLTHYGLGVCYVHLDSPEAAALEFAKSLELKPDFERARRSLETVRAVLQNRGKP